MYLYYVILFSAGLLAGTVLFWHLPLLRKTEKKGLCISAIIPARNESANIGGIIKDLFVQTLKPAQIICVDDESSDDTAVVARQAGAQVIPAGSRQNGWTGKTWACQVGANGATADILLFIDADTRLSEDAIEIIASEYDRGVLSVQPYHKVRRFFEHFSMFFNMITVAATGAGMPFVRPRGMFGPVLMVPKALFNSVGGYERVKSSVLEDFKLGELYRSNDIPVNLFVGSRKISYRMYSDPKSLWQGWTKNISSGAMSVSIPIFALVFIWLAALTGSAAVLVHSLICGLRLYLPASIAYVFFVLQTFFVARRVGDFRWYGALLFPVFLLGFHVIFFASLIKKLAFRKVTWKGRDIDTRSA